MIALVLAAAAFSASYDCTLDVPKALKQEGNEVSLNAINFPGVAEGAWRFRADVKHDKGGVNIDIAWPENPIQLAGKFAGMPTADGSVAFVTFSAGPCMFTETGCLSLVNLVDYGDGTAKVIITPSALATDDIQKKREPFVVVIEGRCSRAGKPQ